MYMNIGIDFDGVVFDFEKNLTVKAELFDYELQQKGLPNGIKNKEKFLFQERYNWNDESKQFFTNNYLDKINEYSDLVTGAKLILEKLKEEKHNLIVISARGEHTPNEIMYADKVIEKYKLEFDEINWNVSNKVKMCMEKNIHIMIDDRYKICKEISDIGITAIHFNDLNYAIPENCQNIISVNNWGEVYKEIKKNEKKLLIKN